MSYQEPIPEVQEALIRIEAVKDALDALALAVRKLATVPRETSTDAMCRLSAQRDVAGHEVEQQSFKARLASVYATNACVARWERRRTR